MKINTIKYCGVFFLVSVLLVLSGCGKKGVTFLRGRWKQEKMLKDPGKRDVFWTFNDDGSVQFEFDPNTNLHLDTVKGQYEYVIKLQVKKYIRVKSPKGLSGMWRIEKLTNKTLSITRVELGPDLLGSPYLHREFTKK